MKLFSASMQPMLLACLSAVTTAGLAAETQPATTATTSAPTLVPLDIFTVPAGL